MSHPILELTGVNKVYASGSLEVHALHDVELTVHEQEYLAPGRDGPVRVGQVHPDEHHRLPRRTDLGSLPARR
ncbi:MAG: hypothetical protein WAL50_07675 [Kineosporiaceae bacterium]